MFETGGAPVKKARLRRRLEEIEASISDLGLLAARLEINEEDEAGRCFSARFASAGDYREFMNLHALLHQNFLRFGVRRA